MQLNLRSEFSRTPEFNESALLFTCRLLVALPLCLVLAAAAKSPNKKPVPPKPEELVGSWVGFWEDSEFTRLELRADATGYCAFVDSPRSIAHDYGVQVYRITRWRVDGWNFVVTLTRSEQRLENIYVKGHADYERLDLEVGGTERKWKEKMVLYKESRIQTSNAEIKTKVEQILSK